jgi:dihydroflavonol-4-reductase
MLRQPVLVTGASGFIGGQLVRRLIEGHGRVSCLVRVHARGDVLRSAGTQLVTGDVTDRGSVDRALAVCARLPLIWSSDSKPRSP